MKLGIVYTSTTPELIECVNEEIKKNLGDAPEILNYQDPSILAEVREHGYVTAGAAARLVGMYMQAVSDGADAVLNCCSSVGEVADAAQDIGRYTGIPIVRIDEEMCREAARLGKRVGVLATLPTPWNQLEYSFPCGKRDESPCRTGGWPGRCFWCRPR